LRVTQDADSPQSRTLQPYLINHSDLMSIELVLAWIIHDASSLCLSRRSHHFEIPKERPSLSSRRSAPSCHPEGAPLLVIPRERRDEGSSEPKVRLPATANRA